MGNITKRMREYRAWVEDLGAECEGVEVTAGSHIKVFVKQGTSRRFFIAAKTPHSQRQKMHFMQVVRAWLRTLQDRR